MVGVALVAIVPASAPAAPPPSVTAAALLVQNGVTGETLLRRDARRRVPIASITKLMTVLVTLERSGLDEVVTVAPAALGDGGSSIFLRAGERLTVRDLVRAALIQSANDAANALAVHVGRGSERRFIRLMNARASSLGLADTHFVRPDGLDTPGHVSSARDVTVLARVVMRRPVVRAIVAERTATIAGGRTLNTWNDLLESFPGVVGVKTGHTSDAGWSQVAAARRGGILIYATLLGSPSRGRRNADLASLLRFGFTRYRAVPVISTARVYARVRTEYDRPSVPLRAARSLVRTVRVDRGLVERVIAPEWVDLPVRKGARLGEVRVFDSRRRLIGRRPLVAAVTVRRPDVRGRIRWYADRALDTARGWLP